MAGESAIYKKFRAEQDAADAAYKSWEKDQWAKNGAEWTKQGYHREEDSNNAWGSKWSYTPNGNSGNSNGIGRGNSGGNGGSGSGSGNIGDLKFDMSSIQGTINNASNIPHYTVGLDLFLTGNKNPLAGDLSILNSDSKASPVTEETPFAYRKGQDSYYAKNNAYIDFMNIYKEATGNIFRTSDPEHNKAFDSWISHYYNDNGFDLFGNKYTLRSVAEEQAALEALRKAKLAERAKSGATSQGYSLAAAMNTAFKNKQGGTMNKVQYFAQGGQPQNQQADAFMKAVLSGDQGAIGQLIQLANKGDKNAAQLIQTILQEEQKGNTQVTKAASVIKQLANGAISAKWGSKLQYMRSLKYARGGKTKSCPVCEQQKVEMKKCGGKKAKKRYFGGYL